MSINIMKKNNEPVVEQSLESTRNIEFQLLNMKKELERVYNKSDSDVDMTPAVSETLETLKQIDTQLQNMYAVLEDYTNLIKNMDSKTEKEFVQGINADRPHPPPSPFRDQPSLPSQQIRYRSEQPHYKPQYERYYQSPYPRRVPPGFYSEQDRTDYDYDYDHDYDYEYRYDYAPEYDHIEEPRYHYGTPRRYYSADRYYYEPSPSPYPRPYPSPYPRPNAEPYPDIQDYPPMFNSGEQGYYHSKRYPSSSTPEPAYNKGFRAVPSRMYKIAYYPWQQTIGDKNPINSRVPYLNMYDLGSEYLVYVELPGVEKENLELRVDEQSIWINGKPTIIGGEDGQPVVQEHGYHEFYRQVQLPSKVISNKTTCIFENGILKIKLVKYNPKKTANRIKIP